MPPARTPTAPGRIHANIFCLSSLSEASCLEIQSQPPVSDIAKFERERMPEAIIAPPIKAPPQLATKETPKTIEIAESKQVAIFLSTDQKPLSAALLADSLSF